MQPQPQSQPQAPPHKVSQGLQVPAVSLYPSRKKVPVKDLPPFGKCLNSFSFLVLFTDMFLQIRKTVFTLENFI
jgi:hypothetical protein